MSETNIDQFDVTFWDERYGAKDPVWSGKPNPQLVTEAAALTPGSALDVGCGEGADSLWLASLGWQVTGLDFSANALRRAGAQADSLGLRVDWVEADLTEWEPAEKRFDLVSAQFMHLAADPRRALFARLADAVAPGGTLLIVGHHPSDLETTIPRPRLHDMFFTGEEIAESLDPGRWEILAAEARPRTVLDPEGQEIAIHDAVLCARSRTRACLVNLFVGLRRSWWFLACLQGPPGREDHELDLPDTSWLGVSGSHATSR